MGDRYVLTVNCSCGEIIEDVYYAPTCGFFECSCPKCEILINLEEYSGIDAESCASTIEGVNFVKELRKNWGRRILNE